MGVNLKQNSDGSMSLQGRDLGEPGFLPVCLAWSASSADGTIFVADRTYRVKGIYPRVNVQGSDGSAVTAVVKKAASGTAITSGVALHTGSIDLKGTANTNQTMTLAATDVLEIAAGTCIGLDFTGTLTAATGSVTISLAPV